MFAVVYSAPAMGPAIFDPEVAMDFARMVHGGQGSAGARSCRPATRSPPMSVKSIEDRNGMGFFVFESVSKNQDGDTVCVGNLDQHRARWLR